MRNLSNTIGPVSYGETSWEDGGTPKAFTGKTSYQELICQANSIPLLNIFKYYNIKVDAHRCIIICPFKSHKGGRENSGSFKYFAETNSFYCWGCKTGGSFAHGCEFVAAMDGISRSNAAIKIIKLFGNQIDIEATDEAYDYLDFSKRLEMMIEFSKIVRNFHRMNLDEKSKQYIERICSIYDTLNFKFKLSNDALRRIIDELKEEITNYNSK